MLGGLQAIQGDRLAMIPKGSEDQARKEAFSTEAQPPLPNLTLRIGVTGHRKEGLPPDEESPKLRRVIREVLAEIQEIVMVVISRKTESGDGTYSDDQPSLRLLSPLAEGADRLVAVEALELGMELHSPLPFARDEYVKDFQSEESRQQFAHLLSRATRVFELDGPADEKRRQGAYEMVGRTVLLQSDILIAIWDQDRPFGVGGTGQIVQEATSLGIPVVWIDPKLRNPPAIWEATPREPGARKDLSLLKRRLRSLLEFPESPEEVTAYRRFLQEKQPRWNHGFFYKTFCKFWVWDWPSPRFKVSDYQADAHRTWKETWKTLDLMEDTGKLRGGTTHPLATGLVSPFAWADGLAEFYANKYRSSFVFTYLMGALAICFAYLGSQSILASGHTYSWLELSLIFAIIGVTAWGRWQRWHQRWMEYRSLAEDLRQMQFLSLLGRSLLSAVSIPAHLEPGDPVNKWFNWYSRALSRQTGLIQARLDNAYLEAYREVLEETLASQLDYHARNANNYQKIAKQLKFAAHTLFVLTLLCCTSHLVIQPPQNAWWAPWLNFGLNLGTIVLPAFAGAFGAILHSGEFERIAARSEDLKIRLGSLAWQGQHMRGVESSRDLGGLAHSLAETARSELATWRFTVMDKDLNLPA
jgi:hypothetical protein